MKYLVEISGITRRRGSREPWGPDTDQAGHALFRALLHEQAAAHAWEAFAVEFEPGGRLTLGMMADGSVLNGSVLAWVDRQFQHGMQAAAPDVTFNPNHWSARRISNLPDEREHHEPILRDTRR